MNTNALLDTFAGNYSPPLTLWEPAAMPPVMTCLPAPFRAPATAALSYSVKGGE